jgi:hypothetical protein
MTKFITALFVLITCSLPDLLASNVCTSHIQRIERQEGIPRNLLAAMARVESGRYNKAKNAVEPWPWTVQSQGKSNYFETKSEAVAHVKALQKKGIKNIDIGCMQMNVEHHGHKFSSIEEMFEPAHNVGRGAEYLKQLKTGKNNAWSTAVGNYHSFTPEHHSRYKNLVLKNLSLVNREDGQGFNRQAGSRGSLYGTSSSRGGLYYTVAGGSEPARREVSASLYSYSRAHGMTGASKPVHKPTHKIVSATAKSRIAQMKSNGVKDLAFMDAKKSD